MRRHPVAYRYAYALFEIAREKNQLQDMADELTDIDHAFNETGLMQRAFTHPDLSNDKKKEILSSAFQEKVSPQVLNLLYLLVDNGRIALFNHVASNYRDLAHDEQGIAEAFVHSAKALTDDEKNAVADTFAKRAGKAKLLITNVVDEHIIGGLKVQIGDTVFDGTVANQLARIQSRMIHGKRK